MPSSSASLFCADEHAVVSLDDAAETGISGEYPSLSSPPEETIIAGLVDSETHFMPLPDYLRRCRDRHVDATARQDSINWILKVHAHYHFRPETAFLAVNYLDRFLSVHSLPQPNGWPFQLLSVTCLSLAAKMEEPTVPLLLDLQLFEPNFVFEPKTVQRMELWVMSNLHWRLRSITPFDYLHFFISKLPSSSSSPRPDSLSRVSSVASDLILSTTRVIDFLGFTPSAMAAAAVLCAAGEAVVESSATNFFPDSVNREMVRSCHQLMEEYLIDTCPTARSKAPGAEPSLPPSPVGVLDAAACRSCDSRSQNAGSSCQAEPPAKRLRSSAPDVHDRR